MLSNNRVVYSDNGILSDLSLAMSTIYYKTATVAVVAAEDAIFLGGDMPFNHRFFYVSTANDVASVVSVYLWNGSDWKAAVDVIDGTTESSGKSLSGSGIIQWTPDRNEGWAKESTTEDIPALSGLKIYNMYWAKLTFSVNLKNTTALQYIGHKFSGDSDLGGYYPDLNTSGAMTAFQSSKTTWDDQSILAAEEIVKYLRKEQLVFSPNQILDWQLFSDASVHKTAAIIFHAFGKDFYDKRDAAEERFKESMNKWSFNLDLNADARLSSGEKIRTIGFIRV